MEIEKENLLILVNELDSLTNKFKGLARKIIVDKSLDMDEFALGTINRAISITEAFRSLYLKNNVLAAVHLIRIQIDNLIRYNSVSIAEDKKYLEYILSGEPINKFKDLNGQKFYDSYLVVKTSESFSELQDMYNKYCGFIHFGKEHLDYIKSYPEIEGVKFRVEIGNFNSFKTEELNCFVQDIILVSVFLYKEINKWSELRLKVIEDIKKTSTN